MTGPNFYHKFEKYKSKAVFNFVTEILMVQSLLDDVLQQFCLRTFEKINFISKIIPKDGKDRNGRNKSVEWT